MTCEGPRVIRVTPVTMAWRWDLNGNGVPDVASEDTNGDTNVDVLDCQGAPGDDLSDFVDRFGNADTGGGGSIGGSCPDSRFIGEVWMFAGDFNPQGTAFTHGQLLAITQSCSRYWAPPMEEMVG